MTDLDDSQEDNSFMRVALCGKADELGNSEFLDNHWGLKLIHGIGDKIIVERMCDE